MGPNYSEFEQTPLWLLELLGASRLLGSKPFMGYRVTHVGMVRFRGIDPSKCEICHGPFETEHWIWALDAGRGPRANDETFFIHGLDDFSLCDSWELAKEFQGSVADEKPKPPRRQ